MASVKAWTALLRGYFTTSILPRLWSEVFGLRTDAATTWTLPVVRAELDRIFRGHYGAQAEEPEAREAVGTVIPAWSWDADVAAGAAPGGGHWTWDATTGLLVHQPRYL